MSNSRIAISLETNLRKLETLTLDFETAVMCYQSSVAGKPFITGTGDNALNAFEDKALHRALLRKHVPCAEL
jgi:hypothetical protein